MAWPTWSSKHAYQLGRTAAIVADGDHIAQLALFALSYSLEYIDEVIRSASAGEDDDAFGLGAGHGSDWRRWRSSKMGLAGTRR